ncbi:hypothetical protein AGMMS49975_23930 [Clostridia bacterium]|nr:hypothetical protein AGMMS49975_23930 [Clostridia bacterium]
MGNEQRVTQALEVIRKYVRISDVFRKFGAGTDGVERGDEIYISCPFHLDESPSLGVNDDKGFWHCFSCGRGGNVVGIYQQLYFKNKGVKLERDSVIDQFIADIPQVRAMLPFASVRTIEQETVTAGFNVKRFNPATATTTTMNDVYRFMKKNGKTEFADIAFAVDLMLSGAEPDTVLAMVKGGGGTSEIATTLTAEELLSALDWS